MEGCWLERILGRGFWVPFDAARGKLFLARSSGEWKSYLNDRAALSRSAAIVVEGLCAKLQTGIECINLQPCRGLDCR